MNKKIYEMNIEYKRLADEAQALLDAGKLEEAKAKMDEVRDYKSAIDLQKELDDAEMALLNDKAQKKSANKETAESATVVRAILKKMGGANLTEAENALLLPSVEHPNGENGEIYVLPSDIRTKVVEKIRSYASMRDVVGYTPTSALTGSIPVEGFETLTGLVDFADGTDGTDNKEIKFTQVKFALKEKAAFIKLSNTLLALSDESLINYVARVFAKKAVITENQMIIAALKSNKSAKALKSWKELASSLNKDLDPAVLSGTVVVTNQTGFDYLDSQVDTTGRPILQPNPAQPTQKLFKGYPIKVFSDALLPNNSKKAPFFYGNTEAGVSLVDLDGKIAFAASKEAGFYSNTTVARLIEFVDAIQMDKSDKCYIFGEIDTTSPAA